MIQKNGQGGGAAGKVILLLDQMPLVQLGCGLDINAQIAHPRSGNGQIDFRLGLLLKRIDTRCKRHNDRKNCGNDQCSHGMKKTSKPALNKSDW